MTKEIRRQIFDNNDLVNNLIEFGDEYEIEISEEKFINFIKEGIQLAKDKSIDGEAMIYLTDDVINQLSFTSNRFETEYEYNHRVNYDKRMFDREFETAKNAAERLGYDLVKKES